MKNISSVIIVIIIGLIVGYLLTFFLFIGGWIYLFIVPSLFGAMVVLIQKGERSVDFVKYLTIGSMLFGIFIPTIFYGNMWYLYHENMRETFDMIVTQSIMPMIFYFTMVSFIAGLLTIVVRGFLGKKFMYQVLHDKKR